MYGLKSVALPSVLAGARAARRKRQRRQSEALATKFRGAPEFSLCLVGCKNEESARISRALSYRVRPYVETMKLRENKI